MAQANSQSANPPTAPCREDNDSSSVTERAEGDSGRDRAYTRMGGPHSLPPLEASWRHEPLSPYEHDKVQCILAACRDRDLEQLRELTTSEGGLIEDEVRRTACMTLAAPTEQLYLLNSIQGQSC